MSRGLQENYQLPITNYQLPITNYPPKFQKIPMHRVLLPVYSLNLLHLGKCLFNRKTYLCYPWETRGKLDIGLILALPRSILQLMVNLGVALAWVWVCKLALALPTLPTGCLGLG
ncbi:MAG TPA: hypothetical protein DDW76_07100 [Cyanobacteria bacterium UBA11369]|nr:hypothetical protein [Cyanobacteria bacterium UBA11371]HBE35415.1 hypothetical protein [Cyanobacteria bacterium UBA11368]HBE48561.1 hypothetical protein [Cyanobacteria bacterium UBA11369]